MSGFLTNMIRKTSSTSSPGTKGQFPLRDAIDPRVIYRLSPQARRISLRVNTADREVSVIVPGVQALAKAKKFANEQREWINVQLEGLPPPQPFLPGGTVLMHGEIYQLLSEPGRGRPKVNHEQRVVTVPAPDQESFAGRVRRFMIREARQALEAATHHYAAQLDKTVSKISVRDTSSRWGSCITRKGEGHISYSWRLVAAPPFVLDYVAAHECAHMIEPNHSADFWAVCASINTDVKRAKTWLRQHGASLHAVGAEY